MPRFGISPITNSLEAVPIKRQLRHTSTVNKPKNSINDNNVKKESKHIATKRKRSSTKSTKREPNKPKPKQPEQSESSEEEITEIKPKRKPRTKQSSKKPKTKTSTKQSTKTSSVKTRKTRNIKVTPLSSSSSHSSSPKPKSKSTSSKLKQSKTHQINIKTLPTDNYLYSKTPKLFTDCCIQCNAKNIYRAINISNQALLNECIKSKELISSMNPRLMCVHNVTPLYYSLLNNNKTSLSTLLNYFKTKHKRVSLPKCKLSYIKTGTPSEYTFGFNTRAINLSRGNRLGNNAFLEDSMNKRTSHDNDPAIYRSRFYGNSKTIGDALYKHDDIFLKFKSFTKLISLNNYKIVDLLYENIDKGNIVIAEHLFHLNTNKELQGFNKVHGLALSTKPNVELDIKNKMSTNKLSTDTKMTPVHFACINPNVAILKDLIAHGGEIEYQDNRGRKPISYAATCQSSEPLKYLISIKCNVNDREKNGYTPLLHACRTSRYDNVKLLIENGANINHKPRPGYAQAIHLACLHDYEDNINIVKYLLQVDASLIDSKGNGSKTPLHYAVENNCEDIVQLLVRSNAKINAVDKFKRTPLLIAAKHGYCRILNYLIQCGANISKADNSDNTPLHYACAYGNIECVKLLIQHGANVNCLNIWKTLPIEIALLKNHFGVVKYLLNSSIVDVNTPFGNGNTILMHTLNDITPDTLNEITYLIKDKHADVNIVNDNQMNAMHFIAKFTYRQYCKVFLNETEKEQLNENEHMKLKQKYITLIQQYINILIDNGCDCDKLNNINQSPLFVAIEEGNFDFALELIKKCKHNIKLNTLDINGLSIFDYCFSNGKTMLNECIDFVKYILDNDTNGTINPEVLNRKTRYGRNALLALCCDYAECFYERFYYLTKVASVSMLTKKKNQQGKRFASFNRSKYTYTLDKNCIPKTKNEAIKAIHTFLKDKLYPLIETLINKGSDPNTSTDIKQFTNAPKYKSKYFNDYGNVTPLMYLMIYPLKQELSSLISKYALDINAKDNYNKTALHYLLLNYEQLYNINKSIYISFFRYFISLPNISIDAVDANGISAMSYCLFKSYLTLSKILNDVHSDNIIYNRNNSNNINPMLYYFKEKKTKQIEFVIKHYKDKINMNEIDVKYKRNVFHYICMNNSTKEEIDFSLYRTLINANVNLCQKDVYERNPLFYLFIKGDNSIKNEDPISSLSFLIEAYNNKGLDLNEKDVLGKSILFYAVEANAVFCVSTLINKGVHIKDNFNIYGNSIFATATTTGNSLAELYSEIKNADVFKEKLYKQKDNIKYQEIEKKIQQEEEETNASVGKTLADFFEINKPIINNSNNNHYGGWAVQNGRFLGNNNNNKDECEIDERKEGLFEDDNDVEFNRRNKSIKDVDMFDINVGDHNEGEGENEYNEEDEDEDEMEIIQNEEDNEEDNEENNEEENDDNKEVKEDSDMNNEEEKDNEFIEDIFKEDNTSNSNSNENDSTNYNNKHAILGYKSISTFGANNNMTKKQLRYQNVKDNLYNFNYPSFIEKAIIDTIDKSYGLSLYSGKNATIYQYKTKNQPEKKEYSDNEDSDNNDDDDESITEEENKSSLNDSYMSIETKETRIESKSLFTNCIQNSKQNIIYYILNQGFDPFTACIESIECNKIKFCISLLERYSSISINLLQQLTSNGQNLLHILSINLHPISQDTMSTIKQFIFKLINEIGLDITLKDNKGNTPLYYACKTKNENLIKLISSFLTNSETSFIEPNLKGKTPLDLLYKYIPNLSPEMLDFVFNLTQNTKKARIIYLLKHFAKTYTPSMKNDFNKNKYNMNKTLLNNKHIALFQLLTNELHFDINEVDCKGNSVYHYCAMFNNESFMFDILLQDNYSTNINKHIQNNKGESVIHLIICPYENASYQNGSFLSKLIKNGFPINLKDKNNKTPFDYANEYNYTSLKQILQQHISDIPMTDVNTHTKDNVEIITKYNYEKEADLFYNETILPYVTQLRNKTPQNLLVTLVDKSSQLKRGNFIVCVDKDNIPYNIDLAKVDINRYQFGEFLFYKLQLLKNIKRNTYLLITRWGRFGMSGQFQKTPFATQNEAVIEFEKIFKSKTGNKWTDVNKDIPNLFIKQNNKFNVVTKTFSQPDIYNINDYFKNEISNIKVSIESSDDINKHLKRLFKFLILNAFNFRFEEKNGFVRNSSRYNRANYDNNNELDNDNMSNKYSMMYYSKETLNKAFNILNEIGINIAKIKSLTDKKKKITINEGMLSNEQSEFNVTHKEIAECNKNILTLTNKYYELIPLSRGCDHSLTEPIYKEELLNEEINTIRSFTYIEQTLKMFIAATYNINTINPIDYIINVIGCTIERLPQKSKEKEIGYSEQDLLYQYIDKTSTKVQRNFYYGNNNTNYKVKNIYKITSSINDKKFNPNNKDNKVLLFHGTKVQNIIGILSQGLKIAPIEATTTGNKYGKGIYLTDYFSKAAQYVNLSKIGSYDNISKGFILVCEAALGKYLQLDDKNKFTSEDKIKSRGYDSIISDAYNHMSLDKDDILYSKEGYGIFQKVCSDTTNSNKGGFYYGNNSGTKDEHAEYVIYNENLVRVKYILEITA